MNNWNRQNVGLAGLNTINCSAKKINATGTIVEFVTTPGSLCDQCSNYGTFTDACDNVTCSESDIACIAEKNDVDLASCWMSENATNQSSCVCNAFSNVSDYNCFWNQNSRITGKFCERCSRSCLGSTHSLYFPQLLVGLILFTPVYPIGRLTITVIASDIIGNAPQVRVQLKAIYNLL